MPFVVSINVCNSSYFLINEAISKLLVFFAFKRRIKMLYNYITYLTTHTGRSGRFLSFFFPVMGRSKVI